jgi:hypothetical protein
VSRQFFTAQLGSFCSPALWSQSWLLEHPLSTGDEGYYSRSSRRNGSSTHAYSFSGAAKESKTDRVYGGSCSRRYRPPWAWR